MRKQKILLYGMSLLLALSTVGCTTTAKDDIKDNEKTLTILSRLMPNETLYLKEESEKWGKENDYNVKVIQDEGDTEAIIELMKTEHSPDIVIGVSHDNLGSYYEENLIEKVPTDIFSDSNYVSSSVSDACSFGGEKYAVPFAMETYALLYNKDVVDEVPSTMEELIQISKDYNSKGLIFDITNFYYSGAFINAYGGYLFGGENGNLNHEDIGLASDGAIEGYKFLSSLLTEHKIIDVKSKWTESMLAMKTNEAIFYISGPWDVTPLQESGVNVGVTTIPTINGEEVPTFLGVQTSIVSSNSKNKDIAWDYLQYLEDNLSDGLTKIGNRIPVITELWEERITNDDIMKGFAEQAKYAVPMPNIPEMQHVWGGFEKMEYLLTSEDIETYAKNIVENIKKNIENKK